MEKEILNFCLEKGLLIDKDVLNLFSETMDIETSKIIIEKLRSQTQKRFITKDLFNENKDQVERVFLSLSKENQPKVEKLKIKLGLSIEIEREFSPERDNDLQEVKIKSMVPSLSKKIEVKDFVTYFKYRLSTMREILQEHSELTNLVSINKLSGNSQGISLIGLVLDKKMTKNKNLILELEDMTGVVKVLINSNKEELIEKAKDIPLDAVVGIKGSGSNEIVFANEIIVPECILHERKKSISDESVLFIGDLHVGSRLFMEENFLKFIDYLNGKVPNTPEVKNIKYLFIIGDLIAGVGIYPGQEKELVIPDVEEQYERAAELLNLIPKHIKIIISPGNHDAVRIMEPQPILDEKFAWAIHNMENVILAGNPALITIGAKKDFVGFDVLAYHGYSYHYYAGNIESLIKDKAVHKPEKIMSYLLKYRHLAPTHSSTLYFPSEEDPFIIKEIPDIILSGHTHKSAVTYYNNVLVVSCSSWESLTPFQEKMGNEPDFCKVPLFNLKTRQVKILDFE